MHRLFIGFAGRTDAPRIFPTLTERERAILVLLAQGQRNAAIAGALYLSQNDAVYKIRDTYTPSGTPDRFVFHFAVGQPF